MIRNSRLLLLGLLLVAPLAQALTPTRVATGSVHQPLFGIAFDGAEGLAVGDGGRVLASHDAGRTWQVGKPAADVGLLGVAVRGTHRIAVGQAGTVLVGTADGGWKRVPVDTGERLLGIDMNASGLAVVVGAFGTILKSTDFGETWRKVGPDWAPVFAAYVDTLGPGFAPHLYGVSIGARGQIRIVGELSTILVADAATADTPAGWQVVQHGGLHEAQADPSLFAIRLREDGVGYAVGQSGRAFVTRDGAKTWAPLELGTGAILLAVEMLGPQRVVIAGIRSLLLSEDDGRTWKPVETPDIANDWYAGAAKPGDDAVCLVGAGGKILRVAD